MIQKQQSEKDLLGQILSKKCQETNTEICKYDRNLGVMYSNSVKFDRKPNPNQTEEIVRALLLIHVLEDLNYSVDNITLEHAVNAKVGRRKEGKKYLDLSISNSLKDIFCAMEIKTPSVFDDEHIDAWEGQLFGLSKFFKKKPNYLAYATYDIENERPKFEIVDTSDFKEFDDWKKRGYVADDALSAQFNKPQSKLLHRAVKGERDLKTKVNSSDISRLQTSLNNVLWGGGHSPILTYLT